VWLASIAASEKHNPSTWLDIDKGAFTVSVKAAPPREDLNEPEIREQLVVEYYSR
jgi:small subunit ribosomal protein S4